MIIRCSCCGKQAVDRPGETSCTTTLIGAVADFGARLFVGYVQRIWTKMVYFQKNMDWFFMIDRCKVIKTQ